MFKLRDGHFIGEGLVCLEISGGINRMSYTRLLYHIVFRTRDSVPGISENYEEMLYRCIWKFTQSHRSILYRVNGMPDHIHLFVEIHQSLAVSEFVRKLKITTHQFLKANNDCFPHFTEWSTGYCALSYSERDKERIINYIKNQKIHHQSIDFMTEMKALMED